MSRPLPVTLLTGFLGAGKTTLLNHLLTTVATVRFVVVENEFGDVGVDGSLLQAPADAVFALNEGCVCCTVRTDLVRLFEQILSRRDDFDHVIVEASGLADPAPVMRVVERLGAALRLDGVVAVVDARHAEGDQDAHHTWTDQVVFADLIVLNKVDLTDEGAVGRLEGRLRALNPLARIVRVEQAQVDVDDVLRVGGHAPSLVPTEQTHHHDDAIGSAVAVTDGDVDVQALDRWLGRLLRSPELELMRVKGVVAVRGVSERFVFQLVRNVIDVSPDRPWGDEARQSKLVFIGKGIDAGMLQAGLDACAQG